MLFPICYVILALSIDIKKVDARETCAQNEFRCEKSKICIDKSLVCDFGRDCGVNDDSDERSCHSYPGRCDFETDSLCDWYPVQGSLSRVSAKDKSDQPSKPKVDHTFRSALAPGHYMMFNLNKGISRYNFVGPRVGLRPKADECLFRFWVQTSQDYHFNDSGPTLSVGYEKIESAELFDLSMVDSRRLEANQNWRRFEVKLLHKSSKLKHLSSLQIDLFNVPRSMSSYLALDDFSFSPGCELTFFGNATPESCQEDEFYCSSSTKVTKANCIPKEYRCDFKNDCGLLHEFDSVASDEFDCPHECNFGDMNTNCGYEIIDDPKKDGSMTINRAFSYSISAHRGSLVVKSEGEKFVGNLNEQLAQSMPKLDEQNSRDFVLELPRFSMAHANCTFELEYEWSSRVSNMCARMFLQSSNPDSITLLRELDNDPGRQRVIFGFGQQRSPFNLLLNVSFRGELLQISGSDYFGTLEIFSYKFSNCAYFPGLIEARTDEQVKYVDYDGYDDNREREDDDDSSSIISDQSSAATPKLNTTCEFGQFQCRKPIVCIWNKFVCDMQNDCQLTEADESITHSCKNEFMYDFESAREDLALNGWHSLDAADSPSRWTQVSGSKRNRHFDKLDPIYDHTRSPHSRDGGGKYLATMSPGYARIMTPRFAIEDESLACQVVFYLYFLSSNSGQAIDKSLRVIQLNFDYEGDKLDKREIDLESMDLRYELTSGQDRGRTLDSWRRISFEIRGKTDFVLLFEGHIEKAARANELVAIDDVSMGRNCRLNPRTQHTSNSSALISLLTQVPVGWEIDQRVAVPIADPSTPEHTEEKPADSAPGGWLSVLIAAGSGSLVALISVVVYFSYQAMPFEVKSGYVGRPVVGPIGGSRVAFSNRLPKKLQGNSESLSIISDQMEARDMRYDYLVSQAPSSTTSEQFALIELNDSIMIFDEPTTTTRNKRYDRD